MKTRTIYECGICGRQYAKAKLAVDCEKSHHIPEIVTREENKELDFDGYPVFIRVGFDNGEDRLYRYSYPVLKGEY